MMKSMFAVVLSSALLFTGCAPYVSGTEVDVFAYACKDQGGLDTISTIPGVTEARCRSGAKVFWKDSVTKYSESIKSNTGTVE